MDFGNILRGIGKGAKAVGGFAANELLGVDDFRRAYNYAKQGNVGRALLSAGTGAFELGSTAIGAGTILKGAKAGTQVAKASRIGGGIVSRIPGFVDEAGQLTKVGRNALQAFRAAETGQNVELFRRAAIEQMAAGASPATTGAQQTTGTVGNYQVSPYGASPTKPAAGQAGTAAAAPAAGAAAGAAGTAGTGGGAGAGAGAGADSAAPAGGLAANDPAVQAAIDADRIVAEQQLQDYVNQLGLARIRGSVAEEEAIRAAARASAGGAVDVAGSFGEMGLGYSPATYMSALEQLRSQEAATRRGVAGQRAGRVAEAGQAEEQARRAYERAMQAIRMRELSGRTGQTISMIQPYLGGA